MGVGSLGSWGTLKDEEGSEEGVGLRTVKETLEDMVAPEQERVSASSHAHICL
jgi:hypothetical protein